MGSSDLILFSNTTVISIRDMNICVMENEDFKELPYLKRLYEISYFFKDNKNL